MAEYQIMKAVEYDKLPAKYRKANPVLGPDRFWLQRKYDGCFAMAYVHPDGLDASRMQSRTGERCLSMDHILRELLEAAQQDYGSGFDPFWVLGEAWRPYHEAKFPQISGQFRRSVPEKSLRFIANDLLPEALDTNTPYRERFNDLMHLLPADPFWSCQVAETYTLHEWEGAAIDYARKWQAEGGFDGAILRDPETGYRVGTVKAGEIVKVKPTLSLDLKVVDVVRKEGDKTGRDVWLLQVEYQGVRSFVGSGMPHVLPEGMGYGSIAEVECLGITEDGLLREPRFKGLRFDKLKPDA